MERRARAAVTLGVVAALFAPVALDRDSFPLSTYPMYSRTRGVEVAFATAQGVDRAGAPSTLTLGVIGDSDDPLVVAGELRSAIRNDRADERCAEIAERAAGWSGLDPEVVAVDIVTERHDVVDQVRGDHSLVERTIHATCEVPGR